MIDQLNSAADLLATVDREVSTLEVPAGAFGADDAAGLPGRLGRRLHSHWSAVLSARAQEAAATAARLTELAAALRETQRHYAETDSAVGQYIERTL